MEDTKFFRCEFDESSPDRHLMASGIHSEALDAEHGWRFRRHIVPTKYRPDVREQFTVVRRTEHKVVSSLQFGEAFIRAA